MSQKSSLPQAAKSVSQVLMSDSENSKWPFVLAVQEVLDDDSGVRLGGIGLDIRHARRAEVTEYKMHVRIEGWDKRCMGHDAHSLRSEGLG